MHSFNQNPIRASCLLKNGESCKKKSEILNWCGFIINFFTTSALFILVLCTTKKKTAEGKWNIVRLAKYTRWNKNKSQNMWWQRAAEGTVLYFSRAFEYIVFTLVFSTLKKYCLYNRKSVGLLQFLPLFHGFIRWRHK